MFSVLCEERSHIPEAGNYVARDPHMGLTLCASSFLACSFFTNSALAKLKDFSSWSISFCLFSKSSVCARTLSDNSEKSPEEMQTTVRDPPHRD